MAKTYVLEMISPIIASQGLPSSAVVRLESQILDAFQLQCRPS